MYVTVSPYSLQKGQSGELEFPNIKSFLFKKRILLRILYWNEQE